ncbi:hypothetical protein O1R50_18070 [Glycomyces luteolus]|uniref:Lipoprotein n=1 Tax=Glycomyces luteolus TaxID=2670330 RepID=A0A9X3T4U9_9ACTN|nr:hypothetical protein [Glycomyces luteolus]MDA1361540.1 hypothetical protein [Glycomyces luteolus]
MKFAAAKTATAAAALLLALAACSEDAGSNGGNGDGGEDPVFAAMKTWDACEVLDNLQPITDFMGIEGWGSSTAAGGEPQTREYDSTWYPDSIGCGNLIYLGENDWTGAGGELGVAIAPAESEDAASTLFEERTANANAAGSGGTDFQETSISGPWDEGFLYTWSGGGESPNTQIVARDGQWVFTFDLDHTLDYGLENRGEPALAFTEDELHQWLIDTYLPEVNQIVNDKIAEVQ